tara:strand:+ start:297 stop:1058 length:762 start_codon:yes stop_codon:yes gene_type:complete
MLSILIDVREKALYKELKSLYSIYPIDENPIDTYIKYKQLDIGDVIIIDENDNNVLIFERKTISDLLSSIKDGRYLEQSFRLQNSSVKNHYITYIIEGSLSETHKDQQNTVISSIYSLSYSKMFSVLRTISVRETAQFLLQYLKKIRKQKDVSMFYENTSSLENKSYTEVIKSTKKSNVTKENIGEIMLMQIPGLSVNCAKAIMNKYKNIIDLIVELQENDDCLNDICIIQKNGTSRKISKTAIENIKIYLMQ